MVSNARPSVEAVIHCYPNSNWEALRRPAIRDNNAASCIRWALKEAIPSIIFNLDGLPSLAPTWTSGRRHQDASRPHGPTRSLSWFQHQSLRSLGRVHGVTLHKEQKHPTCPSCVILRQLIMLRLTMTMTKTSD